MTTLPSFTQEDKDDAVKHWSLYGQRGRTPSHRVTPWDWHNKPFISPVISPWEVRLEPTQLALLLLGFVPSTEIAPAEHLIVGEVATMHSFTSLSLDPNVPASPDKWFIFADGPDHRGEVRVHMHRSWTGYKQMELVIDTGYQGFGVGGGGASIMSIIWESDSQKGMKDKSPERYKTVAREVCNWILNVTLPPEISLGDLEGPLLDYIADGQTEGPQPSPGVAPTPTRSTTTTEATSHHSIPRRQVPRPHSQQALLDASMTPLTLPLYGAAWFRVPETTGNKAVPLPDLTEEEKRFVFQIQSSGQPVNSIAPMVLASALGYNGILAKLISGGRNVNTPDSTGQTALDAAVHSNKLQTVQYLISVGANINLANESQETALISAVKGDKREIADLLMKRPDIDPNKTDMMGWTALAHAGFKGNEQMVATLIWGARVGAQIESPRSPLYWIRANGHHDIVKMLQTASMSTSNHPPNRILILAAPHIFDPHGATQQQAKELVIPLEINSQFIMARVSTGTQQCVCGTALAERLGIDKLLDTRFAGTLRSMTGAGGQVMGRIHNVAIKFAGQTISHSLTLTDSKGNDLILGLDFFARLGGRFDFGANLFITESDKIPRDLRSIPMYDIL